MIEDHEMLELGAVPGHPCAHPYGPYDRDPEYVLDFSSGRPDEPEDSLWEDAKGVWSLYHPSALLPMHPRLWSGYDLYSLGVRELGLDELDRLSNVEVETILTIASADHRQMTARHKQEVDDAE